MRGVIKKMRLTNRSPTLTTHDSPFEDGEYWNADGQGMNGKDEEIEGGYIPRGEMWDQEIMEQRPSLQVFD